MKIKSIKKVVGKKLVGGTLPDIDTDFPGRARAKVKEYMGKRFGERQVASVGSVTTFQVKSSIKDISKQITNDFATANYVTGMMDNKVLTMIDLYRAAAKEKKIKKYIKENSDIFYIIPSILNQPKAKSIHPCAIIVFPDIMDASQWVPTRTQNGLEVTEWSGTELEEVGFLKEDMLSIKQLDKFEDIFELIRKSGKEVPNIYDLPEDSNVYRYFGNGWNGDIFQLGSDGQTEYTKQLKPQSKEDLIAANALYRPGPMENHYHEIYVKCKNEGRKPKYLWGTESITKNTYGLLVYQEQIMEVCQKLGGLTLNEADSVRKAMGKKKLSVLLPWKDRLKNGYLKNGATEEQFNESWDVMLEFAKYSFNRSHSASYALTAYAGMYLKIHFPLEYWTVALKYSDEKNTLKFLSEISQAKAITILPPDINFSGTSMKSNLTKKNIYWGIESIKGIGENTANQIIEEREKNGRYTSLLNFVDRHTFKGSKVKKQTFEALISSGAFDEVHEIGDNEKNKRNYLLQSFREHKNVKILNPKKDVYSTKNLNSSWWWILKQKALTGLAFFDYKKLIKECGILAPMFSPNEINTRQIRGIEKSFGGYVVEYNEGKSRKGKYARITIEHNYKLLKVVVWSDEYNRLKEKLSICDKSIILFTAKLQYEEKWTKGNQFTFTQNSKLVVLK